MFYYEHIAYATAIYRTVDFLNTNIEYEKYSKFNDWPFMVKIAKYGNVVLFDDGNLFLVRRHDKQDTWTFTNSPSIIQIINWNLCFFEAMELRKSLFWFMDKEYLKFSLKGVCFIVGKYISFASMEEKRNNSLRTVKHLVETKTDMIFPIVIYKLLRFIKTTKVYTFTLNEFWLIRRALVSLMVKINRKLHRNFIP
jgi:hypothetical protein